MLNKLIITISAAAGTFTRSLGRAICHFRVGCLWTVWRSTHYCRGCFYCSCRTQCGAAYNNCWTIYATTIALSYKKAKIKIKNMDTLIKAVRHCNVVGCLCPWEKLQKINYFLTELLMLIPTKLNFKKCFAQHGGKTRPYGCERMSDDVFAISFSYTPRRWRSNDEIQFVHQFYRRRFVYCKKIKSDSDTIFTSSFLLEKWCTRKVSWYKRCSSSAFLSLY